MELLQMLQVIKKRLLIVILFPVIFSIFSGIFSTIYLTPQFKATSTLIVGKNDNDENQKMQYNDILMYQKLVKTYLEIAKSRGVSEETVKTLSFSISPETLQGRLTVSPASDTAVIYISYVSENPGDAAKIVNKLSEIFIKRAGELIEGGNVQIIDMAKVPKSPFKPRTVMNMAIAFFLGLMGALGLVFLLEYMDSTIKTIEDVEGNLGIPVIGIIPNSGTV